MILVSFEVFVSCSCFFLLRRRDQFDVPCRKTFCMVLTAVSHGLVAPAIMMVIYTEKITISIGGKYSRIFFLSTVCYAREEVSLLFIQR